MQKEIKIPENVEVVVEGKKVVVRGKNGELEREFSDPRYNHSILIEKKDGTLVVSTNEKKKGLAYKMVNTIAAHVRNMILGVQKAFEYKLKIHYVHFPMTVEVKDGKVLIKNFLGEKGARVANIVGDTKVKVEKDIITVILDVKLPVIIGLPYKKGDRYYNASLFFDHNGEIKGIYFKRHLVPFGEYVPLKKLFFWIEKIYPIANYAPGKKCGVFEFNGVKFGVLICFEIMFPNLVKDAVKNGAEFIVNQSDEGWFPNSAEIYLTHQIAVFRAIEARRTIVRVTNTGLTSVIDFTGKSIYNLDPYKADLLVISIPVRNRDK